MTLTAAINCRDFVRLQTFVDDPAGTVVGSPDQRTSSLLRTVIFWLVIGGQSSWKKGAGGRDVEWIGARLRTWTNSTNAAGVTIGITADRIRTLAEQRIALTKYGLQVPKQVVRQLAGLASWISTLMPQLSAYTAMLWGALSTTTSPISACVSTSLTTSMADGILRPESASARTPLQKTVGLHGSNNLRRLVDWGRRHAPSGSARSFRDPHEADHSILGRPVDSRGSFVAANCAWRSRRPSKMRSTDSIAECGDLASFAGQDKDLSPLSATQWACSSTHDECEHENQYSMVSLASWHYSLLLWERTCELHIWSERNKTCDALSRLRQGAHPELPLLREAVRVKRTLTPRKLLDSILHSIE